MSRRYIHYNTTATTATIFESELSIAPSVDRSIHKDR